MNKRVADILVETLEAAGVKNCYGIVGDTMNQFAHSLDRSSIDFVHVRHEEVGAFAAGAEAQLMQRLTACAGSCGPGTLHFINGLYDANRNRAPVVVIATQIVRQDLGFDSIQEVDYKDVFRGCSVYIDMIITPEQARRKAVAACQAALAKRGVAILIVPADISNAYVDDKAPFSVHVAAPLIRPNDAELDEIAALINAGGHTTIYAGAGCAGAHDELIALADRLKAPIAHTSRGKDFIEYDNPFDVGMTGIIGGSAGYHAVRKCDVLILLGADFAWGQFYPDNATIIQIDIDPTHLGRRHPVTLGAVGSIQPTLEALLPRLHQFTDTRFMDGYIKTHRKTQQAMKDERPSGPDDSISGTYLTQVINRLAAPDALFAVDDGTPTVWMARQIETGGKRRTFASLLHGTMAAGMAAAIGLQKCQPERQVIALCGDGGFSMLMGDLLTLVQENFPIKLVIYDNGKLGFVDIEQKAAGLVPVFTNLKNPDFGAVARAVGLWWGGIVDKAGDLEDAVADWLSQPGPALLHVKVNPMQLVTPPTIIPEAVIGMAVYSAKAILQGKGHDVWEMVVENI